MGLRVCTVWCALLIPVVISVLLTIPDPDLDPQEVFGRKQGEVNSLEDAAFTAAELPEAASAPSCGTIHQDIDRAGLKLDAGSWFDIAVDDPAFTCSERGWLQSGKGNQGWNPSRWSNPPTGCTANSTHVYDKQTGRYLGLYQDQWADPEHYRQQEEKDAAIADEREAVQVRGQPFMQEERSAEGLLAQSCRFGRAGELGEGGDPRVQKQFAQRWSARSPLVGDAAAVLALLANKTVSQCR
jgi:hypothetical protein